MTRRFATPHHRRRRELLQIGLLGSLASPLTAAAAKSTQPGFGRAKSVIVIYCSGGQSQLEMWDPKPDAPAEIRGAFATIPTAIPGVRFGEHLPRTAAIADKLAIIRSMTHEDTDHGSATYQALTGRAHAQRSSNPPPMPTDAPTIGALLHRVRPSDRFPHTAVHLNGPALVPVLPAPGQNGGLLGKEFDPLVLGDVTAPVSPLAHLDPQTELPTIRLHERRSLLASIDQQRHDWAADRRRLDMDIRFQQAYQMLDTPQCRGAFDLAQEPAVLRDAYGRHRSGQACLLARRLAEAGVPYINVIWCQSNRGQDDQPDNTDAYGWDTHNDIFEALRDRLLPRFDQTFATLITDLENRGLLDQTLVICMGEFGRAPRVALEARFAGSTPGRKHWANAYSIVLAGAGIRPGTVFGASDRIASTPVANPVLPADVVATLFSSLGIDPEGHYLNAIGQPSQLALGQPLAGLY